VAEPAGFLEQGRVDCGLSQAELWFRYFELGGMGTVMEVEAYLFGALKPTDHDHDLLAVALNERFFELGHDYPIAYTDDQPGQTEEIGQTEDTDG